MSWVRRQAFGIWAHVCVALPWVTLMAVAWFFLLVVSQVIGERTADGDTPWNSDFAVYHQAGHLLAHGHLEEVYRVVDADYVETTDLPPIWATYMENLASWGKYSFPHLPWHAVMMLPLGALGVRDAYLENGAIMLSALIVACWLLVRFTRPGWLWASLMLLLIMLAPIVGGVPNWDDPRLRLQWSFMESNVGDEGSALVAAFWWGQPTPLIAAFVVGSLIATARGRLGLT